MASACGGVLAGIPKTLFCFSLSLKPELREMIFDTRGDIFSDLPPHGGGGGQKKLVLQKKTFPRMPHMKHIFMVFPLHKIPLALAGIPMIGYIRATSPSPTCHLRHVAVGGPFSITCFAAQWHH